MAATEATGAALASASFFGPGFAVGFAALAVGLIGMGAALAISRNPGATGQITTIAILAIALAEGLGIMAMFLVKTPF